LEYNSLFFLILQYKINVADTYLLLPGGTELASIQRTFFAFDTVKYVNDDLQLVVKNLKISLIVKIF